MKVVRRRTEWLVYVAAALVCTAYVAARADLVPRWGEWYTGDDPPFVQLEVRALLSGRLALAPHPSASAHDEDWGRGGMHTNFGLGEPILALPLHVLARLFGAPGFPDDLRFLVFYCVTAVLLARALYRAAPSEPGALVASVAAAGFVMVFPTFVGLVSARFHVYEQTIATGALWNVALLAGLLALARRCTPARLVLLCGAAGFSILIRPPLAVYGATTAAAAAVVARRRGLDARSLAAGVAAYLAVTALYFGGNALRFGSALNTGYGNTISTTLVNRQTRWGVAFADVPWTAAAKELLLTCFFLEPIPSDAMAWAPPPSLQPHVQAERWREYYCPTYDLLVLAIWLAAVAVVCAKLFALGRQRGGAARRGGDRALLVGAWALPPSIVLFAFYARLGCIVTRYLADMYPAMAAACLCVGIAVVDWARRRAPARAPPAQLAIAACAGLYIAGWRGWVEHVTHPVDAKTLAARIDAVAARAADMPQVAGEFECHDARDKQPVYTHLAEWQADCTFRSGMVFAMRHQACVAFTFGPGPGTLPPGASQSPSRA